MPNSMPPLPIDVFSDVVCPWCFIGKRRLERALTLAPEIPVVINWRPYFLNPWVPREGMSRADYLTAKFGSVDRYTSMAQRVVEAAQSEGLTYAINKIARQPNTLDCHRLIRWAGESGATGCMEQRLMELYFTEGADLSDRAVLVQAAVDCGMDGDRVRDLLAGDNDIEQVEAEANAAKNAGIDGVPCFIFGGVFAVSGAQAPNYLADAISRAAAELAKRASAPVAAPGLQI
ncbi:MAG: DsbA family oxidoreductase [Bradyrhizobiaceae bacterium]|nr:DsbA family oxidoreductase [Bradyrhizobiaceae bacterium]